jgi:type I restriction enzyme M protein
VKVSKSNTSTIGTTSPSASLFGIEISDGIARTAKMNMIIHDDGHTNVIAFDGLEVHRQVMPARRPINYAASKENAFDYIITNPPFGSKVKFAEKRYLENYTLRQERRGLDRRQAQRA